MIKDAMLMSSPCERDRMTAVTLMKTEWRDRGSIHVSIVVYYYYYYNKIGEVYLLKIYSHSHNLTWKKQPQIKWVNLQTPNFKKKKNTGKWEWESWRENGQNKRSGEIITDSCFEHSHGQRKRGENACRATKVTLYGCFITNVFYALNILLRGWWKKCCRLNFLWQHKQTLDFTTSAISIPFTCASRRER